MRNRFLLSMLGFGLAAFLMGSATMAWFTSSTSVSNNTFATGTLNIAAGAPATWTGTYNNMAPGQSVSTTITVSNSGTLPLIFRYYETNLNSTNGGLTAGDAAHPALAAKLQLQIVDVTDSAHPNQMYNGAFNGLAKANAVSAGVTLAPAQGTTPAQQRLYQLTVSLPSDADNFYAGKNVSVSFQFDATQPENATFQGL